MIVCLFVVALVLLLLAAVAELVNTKRLLRLEKEWSVAYAAAHSTVSEELHHTQDEIKELEAQVRSLRDQCSRFSRWGNAEARFRDRAMRWIEGSRLGVAGPIAVMEELKAIDADIQKQNSNGWRGP